jgi:hypothetical protein
MADQHQDRHSDCVGYLTDQIALLDAFNFNFGQGDAWRR